jgi:tRNA modification GTPase
MIAAGLFFFAAAAHVMNLDDTIVAIATPPGRGGLGVVRLSGGEARAIAEGMLRLPAGRKLEANRAIFCELVDAAQVHQETAERIDEVVVTFFTAPHSYTTEDVVEVSCHGSPVVLARVVEMAVASGARMAAPGEFTQRAFLHGRLDLTQAEAVRDLIDAESLYQAKVAARQLHGELSHTVTPIKHALVELIARLEAGLDFAEDEVSEMPAAEITAAITSIAAPLHKLEASFAFGRLVQAGLTLAIIGRPNVGKSSLFNRLVERERAIVTAAPGTTRDLVTETVTLGGLPVRLVDTAGLREVMDEAGLREGIDEAEAIGIRKSMEALADADLVLVVLDASRPLSDVDRELLNDVREREAVVVLNKCDLGEAAAPATELPVVRCSAVNGAGVAEVREAILRSIRGGGAQPEGALVTNLRQQQTVHASVGALQAAATSVANRVPHEMLLLDLYSALRALVELTGATTTDDILDVIFATFCIGK